MSRSTLATVAWKLYLGNPANIPLTGHAQIQLEVGTPFVGAESIPWPAGL